MVALLDLASYILSSRVDHCHLNDLFYIFRLQEYFPVRLCENGVNNVNGIWSLEKPRNRPSGFDMSEIVLAKWNKQFYHSEILEIWTVSTFNRTLAELNCRRRVMRIIISIENYKTQFPTCKQRGEKEKRKEKEIPTQTLAKKGALSRWFKRWDGQQFS